jgi:hypothetical protein
MAKTAKQMDDEVTNVPTEFVYEDEHPVLNIPFIVRVGSQKFNGTGISLTAAYVQSPEIGGLEDDSTHIVDLTFLFENFSVTIRPEVIVAKKRKSGELTLQFLNPTGDHLPQLRYVLNSFIAGDFVSLGSMMSYSGPTEVKAEGKGADAPTYQRLRSAAVAVMSVALIGVAAGILIKRNTEFYELRPVFIERSGKEMRATSAGQISYMNPAARVGEVVFSIDAITGDVFNYKLPCDCEVSVSEEIFEGATVLPKDLILTIFDPSVTVRVQAQMSIEGLSRAMSGDKTYLDFNDGRTVPVEVVATTATYEANQAGELFAPVNLVSEEGTLTTQDIGESARLRISKSLFGGTLFDRMGTQ